MRRNLISNGWNRGAAESAFCILKKKRSANKWMVAGLMIAGGIQVAADEQDQTWLTGTIKGELIDGVSLKVAEQIRYKDETRCYRHTDLGIGYKLSKSWSVCGTFRTVEKKNKADEWQGCNGAMLDLVHQVKGYGVQLKSRLRLSYFDPDDPADCSTDVRPRFDLMPATGLSAWRLKPYLADEIMVDLEEKNLYRNRMIVGLRASPAKTLSLDLFVMQECTEKNSRWAENWNSGLTVTLNF